MPDRHGHQRQRRSPPTLRRPRVPAGQRLVRQHGWLTTDHPEAAATLLNYLVNAPEVGAAFGTNRGLPASETQLEGAELDPLGEQIAAYEESIADRLGDAPPVPIVGYGTLEEKFRQIGQDLGYGTLTVDEAVEQFFAEMDVVLNQ